MQTPLALTHTESNRDRTAGDNDVTTKNSALIMAAIGGDEDSVRLLIETGADPSARDVDWNRPLICAAHHGHKRIVSRLLEAGANPAGRDGLGRNARQAAEDRGHMGVVEVLDAMTNTR